MADFLQAHLPLEKKEGLGKDGYHGPTGPDKGGETVNGITRVFLPQAPVWRIVDRLKALPGFPGTLNGNEELTEASRFTYKAVFWTPYGLDLCEDQQLANEIYEELVNLGPGGGGRVLQRVLNVLNVKGDEQGNTVELWPALKVDGDAGPTTQKALIACVKAGRADSLFNGMNSLQGARYIERCEQDPTQKVYAAGWLRRVEAYKA